MVKRRKTNLQIKRNRFIAFACIAAIIILGGFLAASINQPPVYVDAKGPTPAR